MARRRYTADQLAPVEKIMSGTLRTPGEPRCGTRRECWQADTLDGTWSFARVEDVGTPWIVKHLPTDFTPTGLVWTALGDARYDAHTGRLWADVWAAALWVLGTLREYDHPAVAINGHDRARAFLTWAAEHGHEPPEATAGYLPAGLVAGRK